MRNRQFDRVYEPDEDMVHFTAAPILDAVTACGITDWLCAKEPGRSTRKAVTCISCLSIAAHFGAASDKQHADNVRRFNNAARPTGHKEST